MKISALISGTTMKFSKKQLWVALLLGACLSLQPTSDVAAQGSWGGSFGGGLGSGGSWGGSGGLLGGRRPVADLLSRIGGRLNGGSTGFGSGGSTGFGSGGSTGFGSGGSTGFGSGGSSGFGSGGGGFLRGGLLRRIFGGSSGFGGSTGAVSFADGAWGGSTGSVVATSNFQSSDFVSTPVIETSSYSPTVAYNNFSMEQSYPVGDQGLDPNYPVYESFAGGNIIGGTTLGGAFGGAFVPTSTPLVDDTFVGQPVVGSSRIEDGGSIDGMLEGAPIPAEPYYDSSPNSIDVPNPGPTSDSTNLTVPREGVDLATADRAVLRLKVPKQAKVYVNGRLTKTPGAVRSFESKNLVAGRVYKYKVKAVIERDGKQLVRSKLISLQAGRVKESLLDFDAPAKTVLALSVPKNASVKLCGKATTLVGTNRRFVTTQLADGETCEGYSVEVSYPVDGEIVKQVRKIDLSAGDIRTLTFDSEVAEQVAKR